MSTASKDVRRSTRLRTPTQFYVPHVSSESDSHQKYKEVQSNSKKRPLGREEISRPTNKWQKRKRTCNKLPLIGNRFSFSRMYSCN